MRQDRDLLYAKFYIPLAMAECERFAEHIRKKQGKEAQQEIAVLQKKIDTMLHRKSQSRHAK